MGLVTDLIDEGQEPTQPTTTEPKSQTLVDSVIGDESQSTKLGLSYKYGSEIHPDVAARVVNLKNKTGLPEDMIHRNIDQIERDAKVSEFDPNKVQSDTPVVAKWIAESPTNAALVKDNLGGVQKIEETVKDFGLISSMYHSLASGLDSMYATAAKIPALVYNVGAIPQNAAAKIFDKPELSAQAPEWLVNNPISKRFESRAESLRTPDMDRSIVDEIGKGNYARAGRTLAAQFMANAPQQAITVLGTIAGYGVPALVSGGVMQAAQVNAEAMKKGADPLAGTTDALLQGTFESAFESLGTFGILKHWEGAIAKSYGKEVSRRVFGDFAKTLLYSVAGEGNEEFWTQIAQDYADYVTGVNPDAMKGTLARAADAGIIGGASGGLMTAPGAVVSGVYRGREIRKATISKDFYNNLGNSIEESKLKEKSPAVIGTLVAQMVKDSPVENVYVSPDSIDEMATKLGQDPLKIIQEAGMMSQYSEAKRTGSDMQIPLSAWAQTPTEFYQGMADEVKFSPDAMSVRQTQKLQEEMKAAAEQAKPEEPTSAQTVGTDITEQLKAAGFDDSTAQNYSRLYESTFKTLGERAGIDPLELFKQYGLNIQRPDIQGTVAEGQTSMSQEAARDLSNLPEVAEESNVGEPYAVFNFNWKLDEGLPSTPYFRIYGDPKAIQEKFGTAWKSDLPLAQIEKLGIPIRGKRPGVTEAPAIQEGVLPQDQQGQSSISPSLPGLPDMRGAREVAANTLFPALSLSDSIASHSDFRKLKIDSSEIVFRYAKQRGIEATPQFAKQLWQEMHDALGEIRKAPPSERVSVATQVEQNYPNIGQDFVTLKDMLYVIGDKEEGTPSFEFFVKDKYQPQHEESYYQGERGEIRFGQDRQFNIDLLKTADLSTFLHETGHFYLEVLGDLAQRPDAAPGIKEDYETVLKYIGATDRKSISRENHETFARSFEAYLMEGKAPSAELRSAFARFKAWLTAIYRQMKNLNVTLTPEVRGVFDRLLATQDELNQVESEQNLQPLFTDPKKVGMNDEEANRYIRAVLEARTETQDELTLRMMKEATREQQSWWKTEREKVEKEVAAEIDQQPEQIAMAVLQNGKLPNGNALPEGMGPVKLSKSIIEKYFPDTNLKNLPRPYVYAAEGGIHPDAAAELFGFRTGAELLFALETAPKRDEVVRQRTDELMNARFGNMLRNPSQIHDAALDSVHNSKRSNLLRMELQHLASNNLSALKGVIRRVSRSIPTVESVRAQAESIIADKRVRDISPLVYQQAESKSARQALEAVLRGDFDSAFESKQRELLNHELWRAATNAKETTQKIVDYMGKFNRVAVREKLAKAGGSYLEQIDSIMERFDFRKSLSLKEADKRKSLLAWVEEQRAAGYEPEIPENVLNDAYRQSYKDTPFSELSGIRDSVKTIEHLAKVKNELIANQKLRDLEAARDEIVSSIQAYHDTTPEKHEFAPVFRNKILEKAQGFFASHTRMEFLFEFLDGNKPHGSVWEILFKPMAEAENVENEKMKGVVENLNKIFSEYTRQERAEWVLKREYIPEIDNHMTKSNMIAAALNLGNEYNREALMTGYKWNDAQVQAVVSRLDARDWKTVQAIWDYIDTFWPEAQALEKELNGLAPEKVKATPVQTKFGEFKGGYYPIVFDRTLSWRQAVLEEKTSVKEMFGGNWAVAMTKHNHLKARTDTGGKPLLLELSGLTSHISDVVHDLSYRRAIVDTHKIINDETVREAVSAAAGTEMYKQLNPWLKAIAGDRRGEPINPIEGLLSRARSGATVVNLGLKLTSGLVQTLGYLNTIKEVGPSYALSGLTDVYLKPWELTKQWNFITERSDMMRDRIENWDRDIRDAMKRLQVVGTPGLAAETAQHFGANRLASFIAAAQSKSPEIQKAFFSFVGYMDLGISVPTWMAAYRKAMDGKLENVKAGDEKGASEYADQVVRQTQSAGGPKDNAAIQRGSEAFKIFTMFYSQLSLQFNQFQKTYNQFRLDRNGYKLVGALALLWFIPAILEDLVRGRPPEGDDEDKWPKWLLRKEFLYPAQTMILMRDIQNSLDGYLRTGQVEFQGSPVFDAISSVVRAGSVPFKAISQDQEVNKADARAIVLASGYIFHLPSRQLWQTASYFYEWMTDKEQPDNVVQGMWRALVSGKRG